MIAQPAWRLHGGCTSNSTTERFDDDFFSAALLFLDHHHDETDSESPSSPEPPGLVWQSAEAGLADTDRSFVSERPAKLPRLRSSMSNTIKPEPAPVSANERVSMSESTPSIAALWGAEVQSFHRSAPRRVNKRKEEIQLLRVQAEALQIRLNSLQTRPRSYPLDASPSMGEVLAWELIARHEHQQRRQSESENRRLKGIASANKRVAKDLRRIAGRYINSKTWDPFRPPPTRAHCAFDCALALDDPGIATMLLATLDQMLLHTESMLPEVTSRSLTRERHGDTHLSVTLQDSRVVPFEVTKTMSAVWNYALLNQTGQPQQWSRAADGSFRSDFVAYMDLGRFRGRAEGKLVVRRVDEPNRTTIVRLSMFHCVTPGKTNRFLTVPMRHFLWMVIDRPPYFDGVSSRIRMCSVSNPRLDVGDPDDPSREADVTELKEMCTQIALQQSEQCHDIVDNMLLGTPPPRGTKSMACQAALQLATSLAIR